MVIFLVAAVTFLLTGCGQSSEGRDKISSEQTASKDKDGCRAENDNSFLLKRSTNKEKFVVGGTLIRELGSEPATLNPVIATDVYEGVVNGGIYETLIKRNNETLEFEPLLAESWEISKDNLSYTFHLRKGVKWHDGKPFTADDVVFSYESIKNPKVAAAHIQSYYQDVKSYSKIDAYTVKCEYSKPYFRAFEFCGGIPVVAKHLFEKGDFNKNPVGRNPVGTGPYVFEKWETGSEIRVKRNPNYWGEPTWLNKIVYKIVLDPTVKLQLLKREELDLASLTPLQWSKQSCSDSFRNSFYRTSYVTPGYSYIGWNSKKPFFKDKETRRAMTHLVDRKAILREILLGLGEIVSSAFYINSPEYPKDLTPHEYNPKLAKKLLEKAGWRDTNNDGIRDRDGVEFRFEFLLPNGSETGEKIATILKEEFFASGIEMNIRKTEWAVFIQNLNERNFDAVTLGWSLGVESDPYQIWHSSQTEKGSNFVGFENARADKLIEQARVEFSRKERIKKYREFTQILYEEQPYTFLFARRSTVVAHKKFDNVILYPLGLDSLEWFIPQNLR